jgi:hypothetical protein
MRDTADALPAAPAPLDEVMLAMDVVDTLRHEQALVEAELGAEARERALVERLKSLYAGQGIEVSDAVIAQGVAALAAERFVYRPPPKGLAVRLARLWIARGRVALLVAVLVGLGGAAWGVDVVVDGYRADRAVAAQAQAEAAFARALERHAADLATTRRALDALAPVDTAPLAAPFAARRDAAARAIGEADAALSALRGANAGAAEGHAVELAALGRTIDDARRAVEQAGSLGELARRVRPLRERAAAAGLDADARAVVAAGFAALDAALAAEDVAAVANAAGRLEADLARAEASYTLRIVSRSGERSGVWRRVRNGNGARNHYLVVEAVDADGRVLALPVENEETQRTETVERFAIRVPESVYERVRADREDNGLVDRREVGAKRRGALAPEWSIETAGGTITRW